MTLDTSHSARPPFPAPVPSEDNQPFWDALGRGELVVQRCPSCGVLQHPPRPMCPECGSFERGWATMTGRGTVFSYVVTHQAIHPSYEGYTPYATVIVELEEGPRLTSNLVDV
ncbi:MAG: zinc ribbon domain-containing protein, partial [Dehalococcoidia bacterium]